MPDWPPLLVPPDELWWFAAGVIAALWTLRRVVRATIRVYKSRPPPKDEDQ